MILGIDPGVNTGLVVIATNTLHPRISHIVKTRAQQSAHERARRIYQEIANIFAIALEPIVAVAIEEIFVQHLGKNAASALLLAQMRGAALAAIPLGIPVFEVHPSRAKIAATGSGRAGKRAIAQISDAQGFAKILRNEHERDAYAIACAGAAIFRGIAR